jgi:hypothetical protein
MVALDDHLGVEEGYRHELYSSGMNFGHRPRHSLLQPLLGLLLGLWSVLRKSRLIHSYDEIHERSTLLLDQANA